jgi:catechol 2,3-dioxygenase-like lactoylglutathione lyase family enzyme
LIVERTDFIAVPVTDIQRSKRFYGETLGLPSVGDGGGWPHTAHIALRVPDVDEARRELESRGVEFDRDETLDTGVCHMAFFKDPDGNQLMLHRRYAPRD